MKIYCSHSQKVFTASSKYYQCRLCLATWYDKEAVPIVITGYSEPYEVDPYYLDRLEAKDLSKKNFIRCKLCKDLLGKRKHYICIVRLWIYSINFRKKK